MERVFDATFTLAAGIRRRQEKHADAEQVRVVESDSEFGCRAGEQPPRDLGQDSRAVATLSIGGDRTPMAEVGHGFDCFGDVRIQQIEKRSARDAEA